MVGLLQAHPYMIAWTSLTGKYIEVIIECQSGFSSDIRLCRLGTTSAIVDGPYGSALAVDNYDTVLFMASGIGIAAQLLAIRHLLDAHINKTARVRRICVAWKIESQGISNSTNEKVSRLLTLSSTIRHGRV